jgi:malate synthase
LQPGVATHADFTILEDIQIGVETLLVLSTGRLCTAVEKEQSSATKMMTACEDIRL